MKILQIIFIILITSFNTIKSQNDLDVLFQWSDESISDQNWVGCAYNEIWGVAKNGHEFAIIGSTQGTHIFDITNPEDGFLAAYIEGADSSPSNCTQRFFMIIMVIYMQLPTKAKVHFK